MNRYLVVAGSSGSRRRRGSVVGAFDNEHEARAAFVALRLRANDVNDWGHLAAVRGPADVRLLCWFGDGQPEPVVSQAPDRATRRWPFRRRG